MDLAFKTLSNAQRKMLAKAQRIYSENLDPAVEYLEGRGILREHAQLAGLGVVDGTIPAHETKKGRLAIPYMTPSGVVNMSFRCIECEKCEGHRKYLMHDGLGNNLYFVQALDYAQHFICIAEGEIDTLTANICGIPTVGVSGSKKWEPHWVEVLDDFEYVFVFEDGDDAGVGFGQLVKKNIPHAISIRMPSGEDVNSMYQHHGKLYLHERLTGGLRDE